MKATVEREIKLAAGPGFDFPALPGAPLATRTFISTYWDTEGRDLAAVGITLRHRVENGRGRWQLKIPHGDDRLELEEDGGPVTPPAALTGLLAGLTRGGARPLAAAAALHTRRSGHRVDTADGTPAAEAVLDTVSVLDGAWVIDGFAEIEVELLEGGREKDLRRIERALREAGAGDGDGRPKLLRVLGVEAPAEGAADSHARLVEAVEAQRRVLVSRDPGTRLGSDPEDLHDMRVATRRIRSYLRVARPLVEPARAARVRDELGWLADRLGTVRDLDVMLEHFAPQVATLDPDEQEVLAAAFLGRMQQEHQRARAGLLAALASDRYFQLLDLLAEPVQLTASRTEGAGAAAGLGPAGAEGAEGAASAVGATAADVAGADGATPAGVAGMPAEATLPALAAAEVERFRKALRRLDEDSPDEALHATRIRGKRARYACELARPLGGKGIDSLIAATKALQDVLGEHQDSSVAEECIRRYLGRSRSAVALPAGRLIERERQRRATARTALPAAYKTFRDAARKAFP